MTERGGDPERPGRPSTSLPEGGGARPGDTVPWAWSPLPSSSGACSPLCAQRPLPEHDCPCGVLAGGSHGLGPGPEDLRGAWAGPWAASPRCHLLDPSGPARPVARPSCSRHEAPPVKATDGAPAPPLAPRRGAMTPTLQGRAVKKGPSQEPGCQPPPGAAGRGGLAAPRPLPHFCARDPSALPHLSRDPHSVFGLYSPFACTSISLFLFSI